jgi:hypothetical protein
MQTTTLFVAITLTALLIAAGVPAATSSGMANATFAVHCYDVGARALTGKAGVVSVERGWSGAREVDRAVYDPQQVTLGQLENWLKEADTYVSTLESSMTATSAKEMSQ